MGDSLQKRIHTLIEQVFACAPGAWMVWCDPQRSWRGLLERVAADRRLAPFTLLIVDEWTAGQFGGPLARRLVQDQIAGGLPFVLYVPVEPSALGWLWAQALLAECIYHRSLGSQLREWGWRPHTLTESEAALAQYARLHLQEDPAGWGGGSLQPDFDLLLRVLAGRDQPDDDNRLLLDLSIETVGLPPAPVAATGGAAAAELDLWRTRCLARLLVTQAHAVAPTYIPEGHELLLRPPYAEGALRLLASWMDSISLAQALPDAILQADRIAQLGSTLGGMADPATVAGPFVSQATEQAFFVAVCNRLAEQAGRALLETMGDLGPLFERHALGFWGHRLAAHPQVVHWGELQRLAGAARELVAATPSLPWPTAAAAVAWYVGGGWHMDRAGEQFTRSLFVATPELVRLIGPLRSIYRARWEETLIAWSQVWSEGGCPVETIAASAGAWLKAALAAARVPTAVLVLDALRYDLGASLAEAVDRQEGVPRTTVVAARAPLPSITALGMGMALPLAEDQLTADLAGGKWQLAAAGSSDNLSLAAGRRAWWAANSPHTELATVAAVANGQAPAPSANCKCLVLYDAAIDEMGHDDQLAFQGSEPALDRYRLVIEQLRNRGWLRILIVTDHGFLHWPANEEKNTEPPAPNSAYSSRRALAYAPDAALPRPWAPAPGGRWRIAVPRGAASFRAYGGLGYFHGGASLQEWIIPCIVVEWPQAAQPVRVQIAPLARILSLRPKVKLLVESESLLREDSIARVVEVVVRSQASQKVLFRSHGSITATADTPELEISLDAVAEVTAGRGTAVMIEARDPISEERLAAQPSTLMIELSGW